MDETQRDVLYAILAKIREQTQANTQIDRLAYAAEHILSGLAIENEETKKSNPKRRRFHEF